MAHRVKDNLPADVASAMEYLREHRRDGVGWVLQIDIYRDHRQPASMVEPGRQRRLLAEVARQRQPADARIGGVGGADHGERAVAAAIVDEQYLERPRGGIVERFQGRDDAFQEHPDRFFLVLDGDYQAEFDHGHA